MKRVYKKLVCGLCMAMTVFSVATCDVKVSAAGYFDPTAKPQMQLQTTTERESLTENENTIGSYLNMEQQSIMDKLDTDYKKINWDVQYSPKGMDGIIISVESYMQGKFPYLLVAITNIYDQDVTFSATGAAKGKSGLDVANIRFYEEAIRPGSTIVKSVFCDSTPTGEIYWSNIELPKVHGESTYWEGDWSFSKDIDGYYQVDYSIKANDYMMAGYVTAVLLDQYGNIIEAAYDYNIDKGYSTYGHIKYFKKEFSGKVVDAAVFTNPLKTK